jgi:diacylglycerol kinase (ATP)
LAYAFRTQRNFRIHLVVGTLAIALSVFLQLSRVEIAIIGLTIGAVLTMELLNTALESVVDLTVRQTYHELAKIAKDCAAGAVLVSALAAVLVAGFLMLPPLFVVIQAYLAQVSS